MATKKTTAEDVKKGAIAVIGSEAKKIIDSLAKGLGVAAGELWGIFIRQYVVKGISEAFTALVLFIGAAVLFQFVGWFALIPVAVGIGLVYGAINYLGNPKYYALNDIVKRIKGFKEDVVSKNSSWR